MSQPAGNWFLTAVVAGMLTACASSEDKPVEPNLLPTNYKQEILDTLSRTLGYPTNVAKPIFPSPRWGRSARTSAIRPASVTMRAMPTIITQAARTASPISTAATSTS